MSEARGLHEAHVELDRHKNWYPCASLLMYASFRSKWVARGVILFHLSTKHATIQQTKPRAPVPTTIASCGLKTPWERKAPTKRRPCKVLSIRLCLCVCLRDIADRLALGVCWGEGIGTSYIIRPAAYPEPDPDAFFGSSWSFLLLSASVGGASGVAASAFGW